MGSNYPNNVSPSDPEAPWNKCEDNQAEIDRLMVEAQEKLASLRKTLSEIEILDPSFNFDWWWDDNL